jgi:membrane-bound lytic murein transglycosylase D
MTRRRRFCLPLAVPVLLSACATAPGPSRAPRIVPPLVAAVPATPPAVKAVLPAQPDDVWSRLRHSFAMADCDADPRIVSWAERYTSDPRRFEARIREAMPRLAYVQQAAADHGVAGEFALLPWVESHFQPVTSRHHQRAAGMWQIVPRTARAMGLEVGRDYDARFDVPAATEGVMGLLSRYHDDLHDWRLVDYAYNAGEFSVRRLVRQHGMPADEPVIPKLPVSRVTREHLTKLLAIACVVREPARFHVNLPLLPAEQQLETVAVKRPMTLDAAARRAGMGSDKLMHLNAAFRDGRIAATHTPAHLLLPRRQAEQWRDAAQQAEDAGLTAGVTPAPVPLPKLASPGNDEPAQSAVENSPPLPPATAAGTIQHHTVRSGESLWQIARRYAVSVRQLERWNRLHGRTLKPGQVLEVSAPR